MNSTSRNRKGRLPERANEPAALRIAAANQHRTGAARRLRLERILVPLDFSEAATEALRFALPFAQETGAKLDLLHVVAPLSVPVDTSYLSEEWTQFEVRQRRDAMGRLRQLAATEIPDSVRAEVQVREGEPADVITMVAEELRSDLVIVSTHGRSGLKHAFLGSTAEGVVRRAHGPVLTVRRRVLGRSGTPQSPPSERINRILVPVDFSAPSRDMLQYAAAFAAQFRASLRLLHVVPTINVPTRVAYAATRLQAAALQQGRRKLKELAARFLPAGVEADQLVRIGAPYDVINEVARREEVDLVIIATHGRTGLKRLFLGSTAERVVRHAPCPVLAVHRNQRSAF